MRALNINLSLIYPPISNQEGEWLWKDKEVREYVKRSKLYMIGHRKELKFKDVNFIQIDFGVIKFKMELDDIISPTISLSAKSIMDYLCTTGNSILFEAGDKLIRIKDEETDTVLLWMTPDKFLYDYSKGMDDEFLVTLETHFDIRVFSKFELYYVGISKSNDSFSRLFETAHHGRLKILSNETQKERTARLTDELMIFLFDLSYFTINTIEKIEDVEYLNYYTDDHIAIVADTEKAFVKLMNTKHNEVKYSKYPYSIDGLYNFDLDRYVFSVNEDITFYTSEIEFVGAYGNDANKDAIFVEGDNAEVLKFSINTIL